MSGRVAMHHAIKDVANHAAVKHQTARRATVVSLTPMTVEVFGYGHLLTEANDFDLSQWVKLYHAVVGIEVGDLALMHQDDSWVLFDIVSGKDVVGIFRDWDIQYGPDTIHPDKP